MTTNENLIVTPTRLGRDELIGAMAVTKTDLHALLIGALETNNLVTEQDIYKTLMVEADGKSAKSAATVSASDLGAYLARMSDTYVVTAYSTSNRVRGFIRTEDGEKAAALGGNFIDLSQASSKATSAIIGSHYASKLLPNGTETMDSIEARLVVLANLNTMADGRWVRSGEIYNACNNSGVHERAAYTHIKNLMKIGLVQHRSRPNPRAGVIHEIRVTQGRQEWDYTPSKIIREFLDIVGGFIVQDPHLIESGLKHVSQTIHDRSWVPALIQRTYHHSGHKGKAAPKKKKAESVTELVD